MNRQDDFILFVSGWGLFFLKYYIGETPTLKSSQCLGRQGKYIGSLDSAAILGTDLDSLFLSVDIDIGGMPKIRMHP